MRLVRLALTAAAVTVLLLAVLGPASGMRAKYGGTLVVGVTQDPGSLDPTMTSTSTSGDIFVAMCLPLYAFAKNHGGYAYVPVLAAALPKVSKDRLSYTVRLRHGIEFNDVLADATPSTASASATPARRTTPGRAGVIFTQFI